MTRDYNVKVVWINPLIFQKILCCLFRAIYILVCWGISRGIAHTDFELEMAVTFVENIKSFVFIYLLLLGGGGCYRTVQFKPQLSGPYEALKWDRKALYVALSYTIATK